MNRHLYFLVGLVVTVASILLMFGTSPVPLPPPTIAPVTPTVRVGQFELIGFDPGHIIRHPFYHWRRPPKQAVRLCQEHNWEGTVVNGEKSAWWRGRGKHEYSEEDAAQLLREDEDNDPPRISLQSKNQESLSPCGWLSPAGREMFRQLIQKFKSQPSTVRPLTSPDADIPSDSTI